MERLVKVNLGEHKLGAEKPPHLFNTKELDALNRKYEAQTEIVDSDRITGVPYNVYSFVGRVIEFFGDKKEFALVEPVENFPPDNLLTEGYLSPVNFHFYRKGKFRCTLNSLFPPEHGNEEKVEVETIVMDNLYSPADGCKRILKGKVYKVKREAITYV